MTHLIHVLLWLATVGAPHQVVPGIRLVADSGEVTALDSTLALAGEALARGRPWQATRLLSPALRDSTSM